MLSESFTHRIAVIDGLRAILCFMVLQEHLTASYNYFFQTSFFDEFPFYFLYDGKAAVSGFFVLSGYVLSMRYTSSLITLKDYFYYIIKRALRLYPAYWVALLVTFTVYLILWRSGYEELIFIDYSLVKFSAGWTVYFNQFFLFFADQHLILPQAWSLYFELGCSLILPVLLWGLRKNIMFFLLLYVVALKLNLHWYSFHFILGAMLVKYHYTLQKFWFSLSTFAKYVLLILGLAMFSINSYSTYLFALMKGNTLDRFVHYEYEFSQLLNGVGFALLLLLVTNATKGVTFFKGKFITRIGKYSYSIFLIHPLVITLILLVFSLAGISPNHLASVLFMYALVYISSCYIASWIWRSIEQPAMKLGK